MDKLKKALRWAVTIGGWIVAAAEIILNNLPN
jgi:hypothetical protein